MSMFQIANKKLIELLFSGVLASHRGGPGSIPGRDMYVPGASSLSIVVTPSPRRDLKHAELRMDMTLVKFLQKVLLCELFLLPGSDLSSRMTGAYPAAPHWTHQALSYFMKPFFMTVRYLNFKAVLRIHDILVRTRIRRSLRTMPLTNVYGSFKMPTKN